LPDYRAYPGKNCFAVFRPKTAVALDRRYFPFENGREHLGS
jgi:hypothetical protein